MSPSSNHLIHHPDWLTPPEPWGVVGVCLGANLGNPYQQLANARRLLEAIPATRAWRWSSVVESEPVGCREAQPVYVNQVGVAHACCSVETLFEAMQQIEAQLGRVRHAGERNAPRCMDIDLLFYGEHRCETTHLTLPHPRMHLRPFVLLPLAELYQEKETLTNV